VVRQLWLKLNSHQVFDNTWLACYGGSPIQAQTEKSCCAVEPKAGRHFIFPTPDRSGCEFARVSFELARQYPSARTIHLVVDNLNIHRGKSLTERYGREAGSRLWQRFTVHYTPSHGSWLNQAEIEIGLFARQCLGRCTIPDLRTLRREVRAWTRRSNRSRS
jgi:DDE superfamily endonuclease